MIYIAVSGNGCALSSDITVSDSVKYEKIKFSFPDSWDGYTKTVVFRHEEKIINVVLNDGEDECFIPHEVIKAPEFTVSVFGILGDSRATSTQARIRVKQSGYGEGDEPSDPTPTEYEQLINLANETKQIAQSVRDDADNGAFKGDPFTYADFTDKQLASLKGKDGADGKDGTNGTDGYSPQKGVDYFTPEDIAGLNIPSVDQTYNPDSSNAQSGKAVKEAVAKLQYGEEIIYDWIYTPNCEPTTRSDYSDSTQVLQPINYDSATGLFECESFPDWFNIATSLYPYDSGLAKGYCTLKSLDKNGKVDTNALLNYKKAIITSTNSPIGIEKVDETHFKLRKNGSADSAVCDVPSNVDVSLFCIGNPIYYKRFDITGCKKIRVELINSYKTCFSRYAHTVLGKNLSVLLRGYIQPGNVFSTNVLEMDIDNAGRVNLYYVNQYFSASNGSTYNFSESLPTYYTENPYGGLGVEKIGDKIFFRLGVVGKNIYAYVGYVFGIVRITKLA